MARVRSVAILVLGVAAVLALSVRAGAAPDDAGLVGRFLSYPSVPHSYRAQRRLEASGSGLSGWIEAETDYDPSTGLKYEVTSQGGSGIIRSHVLVPMLQQEQELIARKQTGTVALSPANYEFAADVPGDDGLGRITLKPRREERALIAGTLLVKPADGELVMLEGRLAKNPSFWTKRVDVVRHYELVNDVVMPVLLESTAQLRLFGRSRLQMTYRYTAIDDLAVGSESSRLFPQVR